MSADLDDSLTGFARASMTYRSHQGHVRARNEDSGLIDVVHGLCVVADGVGGQGDGLWAGKRVLELVDAALSRVAPARSADVAEREALLLAALNQANDAMIAENAAAGRQPSGSTIAGLWCPPRSEWVTTFNVGDSPVFHLSATGFHKISRDHSLFQMWVDGGRVGKEPSKRMIVQAMGITERLTPHIVSFPIRKGDNVLLCTDGVTGAVDRGSLVSLLKEAASPTTACESIISYALAGPAVDNLTVSVCRF